MPCANIPKVFDDLTTNMIEAGETGGILDIILQRLATYVEKAVRLRAAVKSALIYPVAVVGMAVLIVGALLKWVVPIFANLFRRTGRGPASAHAHRHGPERFRADLLVDGPPGPGSACSSASSRFANIRAAGTTSTRCSCILPVLGSLLRKIAVGRFTRTLGTLITSGVPILEGLSITARTSGNAVLEEALMKVRKAIEEGRTIVDPLRECGVFPNMVTQMIGVGEATGAMDSMLQKIADFYEEEVDAATKDMLAMLEPVIIGIARRDRRRHRDFALHAAVLDDRQTGRLSRSNRRRQAGTGNEVPPASNLEAQDRDADPHSMSAIGWPGWSRSGF